MEGRLFAALALLAAPLAQGDRHARVAEDFKDERQRVLVAIGQRHLEYGLELRKKGLSIQSAAQIVLAVDTSRGKNDGARFVLAIMRQFEDEFWKRKPVAATPQKLEAYAKKARALRLEDQSDLVELVKWALRKNLDELAFEELAAVLLEVDEPLAFDERGALVLANERIAGDLAERVKASAVEINGKPYVRDTLLRRVPEVVRLFETSSPALRVRSTTSAEEASHLHAAASALLPVLDAALGLTPERRLQLIVLGERRHYGSYLDIAGLSSHRAADGFADRLAGAAVVCSQNAVGETLDAENLLGLAFHELAHLHQLSVSPAAFPSWYREGSAEAFGGEGTFAWDGTTLVTRQKLAPARLAELRAAPLPLAELLAGDALALLARDRAGARRFYAQSWAFLRFLEEGAGPEVAERLERWRQMCLGSILGADLYKPYAMDSAASQKLFLELFEKNLGRLEREFAVWLANQ